MTNAYRYPNEAKFASMVVTSIFLFTLLSFLAMTLPLLGMPEPVSVDKPTVNDGFREAISFDEMFSGSKYWR